MKSTEMLIFWSAQWLLVLHQLHVHQAAHIPLELCPNVEGGMYPAVVVQHFALYSTAHLKIDQVPKILFGHTDVARSKEQSHRDSIVKSEHKVVNGDSTGLDHGLEVAGNVHHDDCSLCPSSQRPTPTASHHLSPSLSRLQLQGIIGIIMVGTLTKGLLETFFCIFYG